MLGVAGSYVLGRLGESFLFGVDGVEPSVILSAAVLARLVTFSAAVMPARRAGSIRAVEALRAE